MGKERVPFKFKPWQRQALAEGSLRFLPEAQRTALLDDIERWLDQWGRMVALTPSPARKKALRGRLQQSGELAALLAKLLRRDGGVRCELMLQGLDWDKGFEAAAVAGYARVDTIAAGIEELASRLRRAAEAFETDRGGQESPEAMLVMFLALAWRERAGQAPSSGSRSRFMQLVDQLADELKVAQISRRVVRRVLAKRD